MLSALDTSACRRPLCSAPRDTRSSASTSNQQVVETINRGSAHINEPDLDILLKSAVQSGNLRASLVPEQADIFVIAVPTPFKADHQPDSSMSSRRRKSIVPFVQRGNLVILESTSPVGTTMDVVAEGLEGDQSCGSERICSSRIVRSGCCLAAS